MTTDEAAKAVVKAKADHFRAIELNHPVPTINHVMRAVDTLDTVLKERDERFREMSVLALGGEVRPVLEMSIAVEDAVQQLETAAPLFCEEECTEMRQVAMNLRAALSASPWVSVKERMPMAEDADAHSHVLWFSGRSHQAEWDDGFYRKHATHWMPIPPLPQQEG